MVHESRRVCLAISSTASFQERSEANAVTMAQQSARIELNTSGEAPPVVALQLRFTSPTGPENVLERTRHVMRLVAAVGAATWPTDEEWRLRLPEWFLHTFEGHSTDQLMTDPNLWDFGSWLDAMKRPGWEWWSSAVSDTVGIVRCAADSDPYSIEPLIYLLRSAGASEVEFEEK